MRSFWSDPYLWVHLAGAAAVPLLLEVCLLGLGVGSPLRPMGLEFGLIGIVGIAPVLWMQWQRPFSIFSLVILALKPDRLTIDQRRILKLFKAPLERVVAVLTAIALLALLWQLYKIAPLASEVTPFGRFGRLGGALVAAIAFLGCNLFLQIPVSVLRVLLTSEKQFAATEPYPIERVAQDFTLLGLHVQQILPTVKAGAKPETKPEIKPEAKAKLEIEAPKPSDEAAIATVANVVTVQPTLEPTVALDEFEDSEEFEGSEDSEEFEDSESSDATLPSAEPVASATANAAAEAVDLVAIDEIPEAEIPEAEISEAEIPEAEIPEAEISEAEIPEAEIPEAEIEPENSPEPDQSTVEPETVLEMVNDSEPISETIHIIELELVEEESYTDMIVTGEEIVVAEETIEVEIQSISEDVTVNLPAEEAIEETTDWEED